MSAVQTRSCPRCGGMNFGAMPNCILCGASMSVIKAPAVATKAPAAATNASSAASNAPSAEADHQFCGECGGKVESGIHFCGECGAPVSSAVHARVAPARPIAPGPAPKLPVTPAPKIEAPAPPPRPPTSQPTTPIRRPCPNCGTTLTPGKEFCRKCGMNLRTGELPPLPTPRRAPPVAPVTVAPAAPAAPKHRSAVVRGILGVIVPVASALATYFLSSKLLGPFFVKQFGPSGQQVGSILCSTLVGGITRQIMK